MNDHMPIYVGEQAVEAFIRFCAEENHTQFFLIADQNTYAVLGQTLFQRMQEQGWDVLVQVLNPERLHTDDFSITRVLAAYDAQPRLFVAVGSGTITDITRFTSHRSRNPFVSFPTATSVDAYTSKNAPATVGGLKGSIYCQAPIAIFTDLPTICNSPKFLTASGFGDSIAKFTSSADWKFTQLIWQADFNEEIYQSALHSARQSAAEVEGIQKGSPDSMAKMMDSQFESGFCMADFANSAPASGGEHHIAHIWEMMFHWENREGLFHGNAAGVAAIIEAEWFERLRTLGKDEAAALLDQAIVPSREFQEAQLRKTLPQIADELIADQPIYIQLADQKILEDCSQRILDQWDAIQTAAANVPAAQQIRDWFELLGAPAKPEELGITAYQAETAKEFGLYLRERFSMNVIRKLFGWK